MKEVRLVIAQLDGSAVDGVDAQAHAHAHDDDEVVAHAHDDDEVVACACVEGVIESF